MKKIKVFLESMLSRKWLAALIAAFVAFGNVKWNWGLSESQVWAVIGPLLAYMGIEGAADLKSRPSK